MVATKNQDREDRGHEGQREDIDRRDPVGLVGGVDPPPHLAGDVDEGVEPQPVAERLGHVLENEEDARDPRKSGRATICQSLSQTGKAESMRQLKTPMPKARAAVIATASAIGPGRMIVAVSKAARMPATTTRPTTTWVPVLSRKRASSASM